MCVAARLQVDMGGEMSGAAIALQKNNGSLDGLQRIQWIAAVLRKLPLTDEWSPSGSDKGFRLGGVLLEALTGRKRNFLG